MTCEWCPERGRKRKAHPVPSSSPLESGDEGRSRSSPRRGTGTASEKEPGPTAGRPGQPRQAHAQAATGGRQSCLHRLSRRYLIGPTDKVVTPFSLQIQGIRIVFNVWELYVYTVILYVDKVHKSRFAVKVLDFSPCCHFPLFLTSSGRSDWETISSANYCNVPSYLPLCLSLSHP